ncbi:SMP-30/gluconolactonase/LRE family protein [Ideonella sp. DXS29W]|uniref:SMP-30/gluconolactonase/LRE family protein n=1 Tax=Ideonella lacteola TaxID=2984193 RepID=A0ABU9BSV1_9BURK
MFTACSSTSLRAPHPVGSAARSSAWVRSVGAVLCAVPVWAQAAWSCPAGPFDFPVPPGAQIARISNALPIDAFNQNGQLNANVEGPVWRDGSVYFTEFGAGANPPPSRIIRYTADGPGVVFAPTAGTNGLATDPSGRLHGASHKVGGIVKFGGAGEETVVVKGYQGVRFNSPNDLTFRSDGTLYFTDPTWQAVNPPPQAQTRVYRVAPGSKKAKVIDADRNQPNGITLSPDEKTLYVSSLSGLYQYAVAANGSVGAPQRFASQIGGADGMVVDCAGNLYVTSGDVIIVNPQGNEIARLKMPAGSGSVTNVAFGGNNRKTLFVTAMGQGQARGLFKVDLAVPGMPY